MTDRKLILASASPRRRELLKRLTDEFEIMVCNDEEHSDADVPCYRVMELAAHKARAIASRLSEPALVIGSDTLVVLDGQVLGKPADEAEAEAMLMRLQGRTHHVVTGVALVDTQTGQCDSFYEETAVRMASLAREEIQAYIQTGEPLDKAGAYAVQGIASKFIESVSGNYDSVVGLPTCILRQKLRQEGFTV